MNNNSILWSKILEKIKNELNSLTFEVWFEETELYELKNGVAKILVPYAFHKKHIKENYTKLITSCFIEELGEPVELEFVIQEEIEEEEILPEETPKNNDIIYEEKENSNFESNLNRKYTFDNFVVGNTNKFAHAAALAVAEKPGAMYNPLFIYGNSGLGKTHLMHAIGNYIEKNSNKKVLYITSETFVNEFIEITRKKENKSDFVNIDFFKKKYRGIDVLIVDDIQFLAKKTESQKEFFHTFNDLYGDEKQIIISSDRSPNDLKIFEDSLRTRFNWGLTVNIYPPDFDLKVAILKRRINAENIEVPDNVVEYMASNIGTDIRSLEGSLYRLVAYSTMMGADINLDLAIEALKDNINSGYSEKNDVGRVQKVVAEHFNISIEDLKSKKRNADIAFPRQIAMYLCRKHTDESFPKIGIEFGGKDHSTVMHSCEKIEQEIKNNKSLAEEIEKMEKDLHN